MFNIDFVTQTICLFLMYPTVLTLITEMKLILITVS